MNLTYPAEIRRLSEEEGGGFLAEALDLPGCMADGESEIEALRNLEDAVGEWIDEAKRLGRPVPEPMTQSRFSGRWVQRVPKSLHMRLARQARREGVSLNQLAATLLAEGLGKRDDLRKEPVEE